MHTLTKALFLLTITSGLPAFGAQTPIMVDHRCMDLASVPGQWIDAAKSSLHIAYGHTSHGSQLTTGMSGLVGFTGGVGGPQFEWNNGGTGGALDLHDGAMAGDVGYYPQWENNTRAYLGDPANADVNVIIWSWCGQVSGYSEQDMIDRYLAPMEQLELDFPSVTFVYMTGHLSYLQRVNTNTRNQQIRDHCIAKGKVLYDFAAIESYDPDNIFYEYASDTCEYWDAGGTSQGNWAINWQNQHTQGIDWYTCPSAHSQPLNANRKAYGAWWLWARLAGWEGLELGTPFCSGDRVGPACPCGNDGVPGSGEGCMNSTGHGALLRATGTPSVAVDSLVLEASQATPNQIGVFIQNTTSTAGASFYGGLLCLSQDTHLLRQYAPPAVLPTVTDASGFGVNAQLLTVGDNLLDTQPGETLYYQYWYRDGVGSCGSGANLSSGLAVTWVP